MTDCLTDKKIYIGSEKMVVECDICGKVVRSRPSLEMHKMYVHGEEQSETQTGSCPECEAELTYGDNYCWNCGKGKWEWKED